MTFHIHTRQCAFAEANASDFACTIIAARDKGAEEDGEVRVVADDENIFEGRKRIQHGAKVCEGAAGGKRRGNLYGALIGGFSADERCGLQTALEGTGDDEVKLHLHAVEDVGELQAKLLAVAV